MSEETGLGNHTSLHPDDLLVLLQNDVVNFNDFQEVNGFREVNMLKEIRAY